jgi:alcohol dehydrogenase
MASQSTADMAGSTKYCQQVKTNECGKRTRTRMKAAVYRSFGGPIRIEDVPIPKTPPDGVLIQVKASGVCRSDWHGWKGHDDDIQSHGLPFVPGHEFSGIVHVVGRDLLFNQSFLKVGDRVVAPFLLSCGTCRYCSQQKPTVCLHQEQPGFTFWGSMAEYVAIPRADRNVRKLPAQVSFSQAAALGCRFTTAYRAVLQQGRLQRGETIAVFGCGGLGLSCIMIAASQGALKIIAVDVSEQALQKAQQLGATHVVLARRDDSNTAYVRRQVEAIADGQGAHVCIDAAGFPSTCENAVYGTRRGGRMVQVGLPIGISDSSSAPRVPMGLVATREIEIYGSHGFAPQDLSDLLVRVANGSLDPGILVDQEVNLAQGAQAIEDMDKGSPLGITMITKFREIRL